MSATHDNPFPGMNPYMEEKWPGIHTRMITHVADALQGQLPDDLVTEVEQDVKVGAADTDPTFRPDVAVREPWSGGAGGGTAVQAPPVPVAKPIIVPTPRPRRRIAIIDSHGHLITVIEILSPSNKDNGGLLKYRRKRDELMDSGVNLVEIDLVRSGGLGTRLLDGSEVNKCFVGDPPPHVISVFRGHGCDERALYPVRYQEPIPAFAVPLRAGERDVALDLQPIIQRCYEGAALWHADYRKDPVPPLSPVDTQWLDELLKGKGLR